MIHGKAMKRNRGTGCGLKLKRNGFASKDKFGLTSMIKKLMHKIM